MFGKHFHYVLVLTMLAGIAYSLPQVKDVLSDSFSGLYPVSNQAAIFNFNPSMRFLDRTKVDVNRPTTTVPMMRDDQRKPVPPMIPIEEIVKILVKEGFISKDNTDKAINLLKDRIRPSDQRPQMMNATTTRPQFRQEQIKQDKIKQEQKFNDDFEDEFKKIDELDN